MKMPHKFGHIRVNFLQSVRLQVTYGLPESIVSDEGQNFKSDLVSKLCKLAKVQKLHSRPYHPQTNGQCKCFNHTLINMLGALPPNKTSSWRDMVPMLEHANNCPRGIAMGLSPYYLMFAKNPGCQVIYNICAQREDMNTTASTKFMEQL